MKLSLLCVMFLAATTACAVEDSEYEVGPADDAVEAAELPVLTEDTVPIPDALAYNRYQITFAGCVTFDKLRNASNRFCRDVYGNSFKATNRNYTNGCSNAPGHGAKQVYFSCYWCAPEVCAIGG